MLISDTLSPFLHEVFSSGMMKQLLNLCGTIPVLCEGK
jgi:hypothetical protein